MSDEARKVSGHYGMCAEPGHPRDCPRCAERYERDRPKPTITEFLLARIAEEEAAMAGAESAAAWPLDMMRPQVSGDSQSSWVVIGRDRVLAECEAKRRIVEEHVRTSRARGDMEGLEFALLALASIYADHPDFRDEWRV